MSKPQQQNGWNEYSRLVLAELEKLNTKVDTLSTEINTINQGMIKIEQIKWTIMHVLLTALLIHHLQFPLMPVW